MRPSVAGFNAPNDKVTAPDAHRVVGHMKHLNHSINARNSNIGLQSTSLSGRL
jgi:hypothetical protein